MTAPAPRPVAVEVGRWPRTRTVFRVFAPARPGGPGWWLLPAGRGWWLNTGPRPVPRFAEYGTEEAARAVCSTWAPPLGTTS